MLFLIKKRVLTIIQNMLFYDKKKEILDVISPYTALMGKNIMHGDTLRYWAKEKRAYSTNVDAVVYTKEK